MCRRGDGRFEGLEVKRSKIYNGSLVGDAGSEKAVCVGLDMSWTWELGKREGGEGGSLMIYDEGLKKPGIVVGETTVEVPKKVPLGVLGGEME